MQFENDGILIWYGTSDAPAPDGSVLEGTEAKIIVGVQPQDASNFIEVRYRVNGGSTQTVAAKFFRNDPLRQVQYFRAYLPPFQAGDRIEYTVICRCAGRQVPPRTDEEQRADSFQVVSAPREEILASNPELADTEQSQNGDQFQSEESQSEKFQPEEIATKINISNSNNVNRDIQEDIPVFSSTKSESISQGSVVAQAVPPKVSTIKISDDRLNSFYNQNPDFDILKFNLLNGQTKNLNWDNIERETTLDLLKKYQRLLRINPNPEIAKKLLNAPSQSELNIQSRSASQDQPSAAPLRFPSEEGLGVGSAHAIASMTEEQFVKMLPGDEAVARQMHKNAVGIKAKTQILWANMRDAVASPHFRSMRVSTTQESDRAALEQNIPSYQEMFGDLDYIDCEHCGSIFSPAAYFVDLMRIVDQYITEPNQDSIRQAGGLTLGDRRPDLAQIKLTCENTNTSIPSLQIINRILEARVGLQSLATAKYPFNLPFHFPLEQIRSYLGHLKTDLGTIYQTFDVNELAIAREYIGLSLEEYNLITNPETKEEELKKLYGIKEEELDSLNNVETFLKQTGLSRTELPELLEQNLHQDELDAGLAHNFYINQVLESDRAVQIKIENLMQLVGYWPMNEVNENEAGEKVVIPDRAGNNNGTLQGNPQWKIVNDFPGVESRSVLEFDGEGDYVEFASENASFGQFEKSNFSIGLWFKTKESSGTLMMGAGSRVDYWRIYLEEGFAKFGFETQGLSGDDGSSNATVNEGKWHHLTAIRDGVRSGKLYLDGVLVDEFNYSGNNVSIEEVSTVFIGKDDKTDYFQGQIAEVRIWNGTTSPLDRINRFIRLAKKLNWSFSDLDWVLTSIETSEIDEEAIKKIAKIKQLQAKYKLPLDVLCSFWHEMKTIGIGSNSKKPQDLFDRVFNNPFQEILGNNFFPIQDEIKQIELNNLDREAEINPIVGRILAALRLNFNQLIDIFPAIWGQEGTVELTVENLSQLFRISQILRLLGLNIEEYQVLLSFLDIESISSLSIDQFIQITELAEWVKESKFKIDELDYIITGKLSSNFDIGYSETDITGGMKSLWQLAVDSLLKPSDFIGEEIDEQKSVDIFEQLLKSHYIKEVTSEYKEVLNISLEEKCAIIIAPNLSDDQEIVREINQIINHQNEGNVNDKNQREETQLSPEIQHLQEILQKADDRQGEQLKEMASFFGIEADLAFSLLYFGSVRFQEKEQQQDIPTSAIPTTDYVKQLLLIPVQKEQEWSEIVKFFQFLSRILILTQKLELTPTELKCIADNQTAFGINKPSEEASFQLTISNIQTIARFKKLIQAFNDDKDKLVEYFTPVSENGESVSEKHQNNPIEGLAEITGWKSEQIEQLVPLLSSAGNKKNNQLNDLHKTVEGITKLQECFNLSRHLGVNISWFNKLLNLKNLPVVGEKVIEGETIANWELYQNAAQAVKEITKAKYDDEEWVKVSEKLEGELNERKRDVLTAWILGQNKYENLRHLSQELLIDVETSSEVSVSIIKEATLAIQTYFHRCRMGLEPGVKKLDIPEIWWQWMMNYRVWEANRKVFLYPENYLDPSLRKIKSPIYKELEEELLQSEITQESVEKAYQNYFEKFAEIAQLKPAGGYRCTVDNNSGAQDTLYLFGRTATEPYTYYYRECINPAANNPTWKAWEKIDLVINSEQINATYAFNKLFIFWVEVITIENKENPDSDPKKETKATIKYSFQKFGKQWMQPQTLAKDIVIKVEDYNENKNLWRKVTALPIPANDSEPQKILTLFGDVKEEKEVQGITLTIDLLQEDSTIKLQDLQDQSFKFIRSLIEGSRLKVKATNNVLYDNYVDDYKDANNISLEHPEQVLIKSNISAYASARMIKNQPEWFTFDNGDEAFLVIPKPQTNQAKKNRKIRTLQGHDSSVRGVSFSPDGTILASGSTDRTIKLWNVETGQEIRTLQGHTDDVRSVSFSPDGTILASGSTDRTIKLWNVETGQEIRTLQGHTDWVNRVSFSPDGTILASGSYRTIKLWKVETGQEIRTLQRHDGSVFSVSFSPDGTILASGSFDRTIKLWNVETGQEIRTLQGHDGSVWSVSFSPDGTILASGSSDDTIKLWNVETGQEIRTLQRHDGSVFSVSFSPDGTILASGSFDRTIKLWNVETGQEIRTLQGHDSNVYSVSFSPDGTILASGSFDRTIKLWYKGGKQIDDSVTLEDSTLSYNNSNFWSPVTKYTFRRLTTSTVQTLSNKMFIGGLDHLLTLDSQLTPELNFDRFSPTDNVIPPESNTLDFDGSLGLYFWEIFFHIPFLVANTLNSNQRFEEAQKWYHYIFNPTTQNNEKGLVGYWPMNEFNENEAGEKVVIPDRVGNNNGTLKGDAKLETVNENDFPVTDSKNVLKLDGNGDYVTLSAANQLGLTNNSFTAEAWINIAEFPESSDLTILGIDQTSKNKGLHLVIRRQKPYMGFFSNDTTGKTVLKTGEWYHLAWRYDDSKQEQAIFVNGQLDISRTGKSPFQGTGTVNIGRWRSGTYFNGQIAEVRIWNVALSAEQILDEVGRHTSDRFWRYLPFRGNILQLQKLQKILSNDDAIKAYNDNPFDPHAIARLRIGAYEKAIVMKYIDNLLDWGDQLFAQDNRESINQATLLYFLAYDLLGEEPENLGKMRSPAPKTFQQIKDKYEDIPQFLIDLENQLSDSSITAIASTPFNDLNTYFCAPENEQFIAYWERVQDRLYKIRHSLSIEGIRRQLALFQPAIDPAQLVRAVAGGQMPLSVVSQLSATVPNYRFDYMLERAKNITSTLIQLGSSLLSALEKKDAEELALLRSSHERTILEMIKTTKEKQIEEAEETKLSLEESKNSAKERNGTYEEWIAADLSDRETKNLEAMKKAENYDSEAGIANKNAAISYAIPQLGSPFAITFGGQQFGAIDGVKGVRKQSKASESTFQAQEFQVREGYDRRKQEWELQRDLSKIDIQQIDKQIKAQEIRKAIAEQELETHKKSIEQAKEIEDFLKGKFTNQELYQWMIGRLSILYFQTYKVALDMAMATQSAYQYELNKDDTYINFDYWDSLKKGLLAGESLMLGLNQLEKAYIEGNVRRLEIEKTISLLQLDPLAFQQLKDTGKCEFELSEKLFDFDFPGHYCRQTKTIAISIPAVVGPYQNISATLTQTSNKTLLKPNVNAVKYLLGEGDPPEDSVLRVNWRRNQKIALSRGAMDNGLFELNFRDERYLPFEGTGAISEWELSLPKAANRIDFDTISDVIITLSYTALDGGDNFRQQVTSLPPLTTYSEAYYFNLKQAFPGEWHTFINSNTDTNSQKLNFHISEEIIPPHIEDAKLMEIIFKLDAPDASSPMSFATIKIGENNIINSNDNSINEKVAGNWFGDWVIDFDLTKVPDSLKKDGFLNPEIVNNIELILIYEGEINWGN